MRRAFLTTIPLLLLFAACDSESIEHQESVESQNDRGEPHTVLDLHLAADVMAWAEERGEPPSIEELEEVAITDLTLEELTVRDIKTGRISPPRATTAFSRIGDESCPQSKMSEAELATNADVDINIDFSNERLLDVPLSQTCVLKREGDASLTLVACEDFVGADGQLEAGDGADISRIVNDQDQPAAACYWCQSYWPCDLRLQQGAINNIFGINYCLAIGWYGCC